MSHVFSLIQLMSHVFSLIQLMSHVFSQSHTVFCCFCFYFYYYIFLYPILSFNYSLLVSYIGLVIHHIFQISFYIQKQCGHRNQHFMMTGCLKWLSNSVKLTIIMQCWFLCLYCLYLQTLYPWYWTFSLIKYSKY